MLKSVSLQNFRSYPKAHFDFSSSSTLIVGPNTAGKSNLLESIYLISAGKSSKAEKDPQMINFGKELGRVKAKVDDLELEIVLTNGNLGGAKSQFKKFLVNGVAKRRVDFTENLNAVMFSPADLDIIIDSPGLRRDFLDEVLEQTDRDYRLAAIAYKKALRQRNALLETARERGPASRFLPAGAHSKHFPSENGSLRAVASSPSSVTPQIAQFEYWDKQVIENGQIITAKREEFINFVNIASKEIFDFQMEYDKSEISAQRLAQYEREELAAGVTLVGPHRDDFKILMRSHDLHDVKYFGSRGQQRLAVLQLKVLELEFIFQKLGKKPLLLLDDVFSELDFSHIKLVLSMKNFDQAIITTTHIEFVAPQFLKKMKLIKL